MITSLRGRGAQRVGHGAATGARRVACQAERAAHKFARALAPRDPRSEWPSRPRAPKQPAAHGSRSRRSPSRWGEPWLPAAAAPLQQGVPIRVQAGAARKPEAAIQGQRRAPGPHPVAALSMKRDWIMAAKARQPRPSERQDTARGCASARIWPWNGGQLRGSAALRLAAESAAQAERSEGWTAPASHPTAWAGAAATGPALRLCSVRRCEL